MQHEGCAHSPATPLLRRAQRMSCVSEFRNHRYFFVRNLRSHVLLRLQSAVDAESEAVDDPMHLFVVIVNLFQDRHFDTVHMIFVAKAALQPAPVKLEFAIAIYIEFTHHF